MTDDSDCTNVKERLALLQSQLFNPNWFDQSDHVRDYIVMHASLSHIINYGYCSNYKSSLSNETSVNVTSPKYPNNLTLLSNERLEILIKEPFGLLSCELFNEHALSTTFEHIQKFAEKVCARSVDDNMVPVLMDKFGTVCLQLSPSCLYFIHLTKLCIVAPKRIRRGVNDDDGSSRKEISVVDLHTLCRKIIKQSAGKLGQTSLTYERDLLNVLLELWLRGQYICFEKHMRNALGKKKHRTYLNDFATRRLAFDEEILPDFTDIYCPSHLKDESSPFSCHPTWFMATFDAYRKMDRFIRQDKTVEDTPKQMEQRLSAIFIRFVHWCEN
jgi:hypothetical protein